MRYRVDLPFAGVMSVYVEADSKEGAIEAAMGSEDLAQVRMHSDSPNVDIDTWEVYRRLSSGNVLHPHHNEADAVEEPDD